MADIKSTWALDFSEFRKGSTGIQQEAAKAAAKVDAEFKKSQKSVMELGKALVGMGLAGAATRFAADSMDKYRASVGEAEGATTSLSKAVERLQVSIGDDLDLALSDAGTGFGGFLDWLGKIRGELVNAEATYLKGLAKLSPAYWIAVGTGHDPFGDGSAGDVDAARKADNDARRQAAATRDSAKRQGGLATGARQARGGPLADIEAREIEEKYKHRDALAEASGAKDVFIMKARVDDENKRHANAVANLKRERAEKEQDFALQMKLAAIDADHNRAQAMRMRGETIAAARLEKGIDRRKELARIEADRTLTPRQKAAKWMQTNVTGLVAEGLAGAEAAKDTNRSRAESRTRLSDELETARIQRMQIDGHQTAAELASIRLDYEQKIRQAMSDQALSTQEQADAAQKLASARDSILRAAGDEAVERATGEYHSAMASRKFRGVESGQGSVASRILGPSGHNESLHVASGGRTEVEKKLDLLNKAQDALHAVLEKIEANQRSGVGAGVGP